MALFNFKIKDPAVFTRMSADIKRQMEKVLSSEAFTREVGEFMVDRIKYQARTTKPTNEESSFPDLKDSSIRSRRYLAKHNPTHDTFEPTRSNLTITGQFLDALKYSLIKAGTVAIEFVGTHRGYLSGTGKRGKSVKNKQLNLWLKEKGFVVFDKSLKDNKTFRARIKSIALRYVRRGLAVSRRLRS